MGTTWTLSHGRPRHHSLLTKASVSRRMTRCRQERAHSTPRGRRRTVGRSASPIGKSQGSWPLPLSRPVSARCSRSSWASICYTSLMSSCFIHESWIFLMRLGQMPSTTELISKCKFTKSFCKRLHQEWRNLIFPLRLFHLNFDWHGMIIAQLPLYCLLCRVKWKSPSIDHGGWNTTDPQRAL